MDAKRDWMVAGCVGDLTSEDPRTCVDGGVVGCSESARLHDVGFNGADRSCGSSAIAVSSINVIIHLGIANAKDAYSCIAVDTHPIALVSPVSPLLFLLLGRRTLRGRLHRSCLSHAASLEASPWVFKAE